jgi:hypothetical protein
MVTGEANYYREVIMSKVSMIAKGAVRSASIVALSAGMLVPFALAATSAGADPTLPTVKVPYPVHPSVYVANLHKVSKTQEQNCVHPTGFYMGSWYCGGYVANKSLTFNAKLLKVSVTQEQNCTYPVGNIGGTWYCGGYVATSSLG